MEQEMKQDVNTVLAGYAKAAAAPGGARLKEWVARYPQFEQELVDFALYDQVFERGQAYAAEEAGEEARLMQCARQVAERMMAEQGVSPMNGLLEEARQRGLMPPALARELDLGLPEVVKLDRRLFDAASLPKKLVSRVSAILDRSFDSVAAYFALPPTLSAQASYKSAQAPRIAGQESFAAAVEASRAMPAEQKALWRAEADDTLGGGA